LWESKRSVYDILRELNNFGEKVEVLVTYEGKGHKEYHDLATFAATAFRNIIFGKFACKRSGEVVLPGSLSFSGGKQGFVALDGKSWHTYLPIPWLWNLIYTRKKTFNEYIFTYVDFL